MGWANPVTNNRDLCRPLDLVIVAYLVSHIFITTFIDSQVAMPRHWYPKARKPGLGSAEPTDSVKQQSPSRAVLRRAPGLVDDHPERLPDEGPADVVQVFLRLRAGLPGRCTRAATPLPPVHPSTRCPAPTLQYPLFYALTYGFIYGKKWVRSWGALYGVHTAT